MTDPGEYLVVAIGADLDYDSDRRVVCGPRTIANCRGAIEAARNAANSRILVTATHSPRYDVFMADVMAAFVRSEAPDIEVSICYAPTFNTLGEVRGVARHMKERLAKGGKFRHVVFAVESDRDVRTSYLVREVFRRGNIEVPFHLKLVFFPAPFWVRWYRHSYERRSLEKNRKRLDELKTV